jgi:hypothetical protein
MGYAGYSPGMNSLMQGPLSDFERALRGLPPDQAAETLEVLEKLTRNVVRSPKELKFRKIRLTNKKIMETITEVEGAVDILRAMGWVDGEDEGAPVLELPDTTNLAFELHVVKLIEVKDWYKKELENRKRAKAREERDLSDPAKAELLEKLRQDAQERAAREQPAQASVAREIKGGANIVRAADLGIGVSKGG